MTNERPEVGMFARLTTRFAATARPLSAVPPRRRYAGPGISAPFIRAVIPSGRTRTESGDRRRWLWARVEVRR